MVLFSSHAATGINSTSLSVEFVLEFSSLRKPSFVSRLTSKLKSPPDQFVESLASVLAFTVVFSGLVQIRGEAVVHLRFTSTKTCVLLCCIKAWLGLQAEPRAVSNPSAASSCIEQGYCIEHP